MRHINSAGLWNRIRKTAAVLILVSVSACGQADTDDSSTALSSETASAEIQASEAAVSEDTEQEDNTMSLMINDKTVSVEWEDNESVEALMEITAEEPLSIRMSMYGGFEQIGDIGMSLPRNDEQITTEAGDIVLYSGNQIVVFYGSNSWAYTRLGKISDRTEAEMAELLGNGDVTITISAE